MPRPDGAELGGIRPRVSVVVLVFVCLRYERGSPAPVFSAFDSYSHRRALRIGAWSTCIPGKVRRSNPLPATLGAASRPNGISDWVRLDLLIWFFRVELADQQGPISKSQISQSPIKRGWCRRALFVKVRDDIQGKTKTAGPPPWV
jgi:hypothetical protein